MPFSEEDRRRLRAFYDPAIDLYGPDDARALRWSELAGQIERFRILAEAGVGDGASVLDVGCGFGDLYGYLAERFRGIAYLGIDINTRMIEAARRKYPEAPFEAADFGEWQAGGERAVRFDYCLASGAFSFKIPDHRSVYFGYVKKMFEHCRVAAAFNMLDSRYHIDDEIFAAYSPAEVEAFCRGLSPRVAIVESRRLRQDFAVYIYR